MTHNSPALHTIKPDHRRNLALCKMRLRLLWVVSVCWAPSPVWLEHMICPTAVVSRCGSSESCPSPLQAEVELTCPFPVKDVLQRKCAFPQPLNPVAAALV